MMTDNIQVAVNFREDTSTSVSFETAEALKERVGASSIEDLIHQALLKLMKASEIAYPPDDRLPTAELLEAIKRITSQDLEVQLISTLFHDFKEMKTSVSEFQLDEMLSRVTEENKHGQIDFSK